VFSRVVVGWFGNAEVAASTLLMLTGAIDE
jgi:hypothetical protein